MKKVGFLLAVMLVAGLVTTAPALAQRPVQDRATFNVPAPFGTEAERFRIVHRIEKAINDVPPRTNGHPSRIFIASYLLDRKISVDALLRACRRGVSVRVVLDEDIESRPSRRLMSRLNADNVTDRDRDGRPDRPAASGPCGTKKPAEKADPEVDRKRHEHRRKHDEARAGRKDRDHGRDRSPRKHRRHKREREPLTEPQTWGTDRSYVVKCDGTCRGRGRGGNAHSKFYLFSRIEKVHHIVMVSSSNLNMGGATLGWNDLWTMHERPKTYRAYARIHRQMTRDHLAPRGRRNVRDGPYHSRFFPLRNPSRANDPTLRDLGKIRCHGPLGPTKVYVSMFYWKGDRGNYLASALLNLARHGCRVGIIYGAPSVKIATRLREAARRGLIDLFDSRWDRNGDGEVDTRTHGKYVLIKGRYGEDDEAWRVLTGSQNWVGGSLGLSDENTLKIRSRPAYGAYVENWNRIRRHSRRLPYHG